MYIIHGVSYTESSIHISIKRVEKSTSFPWIFPGWERGCRKVIDFALLCRTTGLKILAQVFIIIVHSRFPAFCEGYMYFKF